jgi:hypothetical protein
VHIPDRRRSGRTGHRIQSHGAAARNGACRSTRRTR